MMRFRARPGGVELVAWKRRGRRVVADDAGAVVGWEWRKRSRREPVVGSPLTPRIRTRRPNTNGSWIRSWTGTGRWTGAAVASSLEDARRGPVSLTPSEADSWLIVINETRLALAARLRIEEEGWVSTVGSRGRPDPEMALLMYLTEVQDDLIQAMADHI